jgi:signal transduction histidine kinase
MATRNRLKILWAFQLTVIISVFYLVTFNYYSSLSLEKDKVLGKLRAIANTASLYLDGNRHRALALLANSDIDSVLYMQEYVEMEHQLQKIQHINNLQSPVYTFIYDSSYHLFQFVASSSGEPVFMNDYIHFPKNLAALSDTGGVLDSYESDNGVWLSAFSPLKDRDGNTVGILKIDEDFTAFIREARFGLLKYAAFAVATVAPLIVFSFYYTRTALKRYQEYENNLMKQQKAIIHQSSIIKNQNRQLLFKHNEVLSLNRQLDSRVRQRTRKLLETTQELKSYLYRSSHDMRTPLSTLLGLCHLMIMEKKVDPYAAMIRETTDLLSKRLSSIAEVYEIKTRRLKIEPVPVHDLLDEVEKNIAPGSNMMICRNFVSGKLINVDRTLALIVLKEVIHNSWAHNRHCNRAIRVCLTIHEEEHGLTLTARDNGEGIPDGDDARPFEMFYRGNPRSTGMGLGLFKVKLIAERCNGKASICSTPSNGSVLTMHIPLPEHTHMT